MVRELLKLYAACAVGALVGYIAGRAFADVYYQPAIDQLRTEHTRILRIVEDDHR